VIKILFTSQIYRIVSSPQEAFAEGKNILLSSGPILNNFCFKEKLIDEVILLTIPEKIGEGIKPFDDIFMSVLNLRLEEQISGEGTRRYYNVQHSVLHKL